MGQRKLAIITGADGGMGTEITRDVAKAGYRVVMACYHPEKGRVVCEQLKTETGNTQLEVEPLDLSSLPSVAAFAEKRLQRGEEIALLMNNAGTLECGFSQTKEGLERTVSVNYVGPYLLTRKLLPLMHRGSRVVNMVFFRRGRRGSFWRIPIYSNTKLALTLFTIDLARRVKEQGIIVNCADPGIVSTKIITMHMWFDPLTDIFFRPFIRTPRQGADTAIRLLLTPEGGQRTGTLNASGHVKKLSAKYTNHPQMETLWRLTEEIVSPWL